MRKLADFTKLEPIFRDTGITPNWLHALTHGYTKVYDGAILNYYLEDGICVINSGSIDNKRFRKSMLRDMQTLINEHKKAIISSEVDSIEKYLSKYGFTYNKSKSFYSKGL